MKNKVLFCANVDSHIKAFHIPYLKWFKEQGYETHVATNGEEEIPFCDVKHMIEIQRSPANIRNIKAYMQLKKLIDIEKFSVIHCHTPMGGILTRIAARKARKGNTSVIYTAHGFHFFKGASRFNWMIYYPIEKFLSRWTDCLITINQEDYNTAIQKNFRTKNIQKVRGVGIDLDKFRPLGIEEKNLLKLQYGYKSEEYILMYVAELSQRKNQEMLINCMPQLVRLIPDLKLVLVGHDALNGKLQKLAKTLKVEESIDFLGRKQDVHQLLNICDIYVSPSKQEGLPVNIMEAMALGLPICSSGIRGSIDLIENGVNGLINNIEDEKALIKNILYMYKNNNKEFEIKTLQKIERYSIKQVLKDMEKIYKVYI